MSNRRNRNSNLNQFENPQVEETVTEPIVETNTVPETPVKKDRTWTDEQKAKLRSQWTPERREAFSEQMKAKYNPETGTLKGRKWTDEQKEAHRQLMKSKYPAKDVPSIEEDTNEDSNEE
jgi:hypothetical protein